LDGRATGEWCCQVTAIDSRYGEDPVHQTRALDIVVILSCYFMGAGKSETHGESQLDQAVFKLRPRTVILRVDGLGFEDAQKVSTLFIDGE
jgi:hypothetical protein